MKLFHRPLLKKLSSEALCSRSMQLLGQLTKCIPHTAVRDLLVL